MQTPLQLSFHNMEPSDFIEAEVRRRVAKLEQFSERIVACRVAVEADNQRQIGRASCRERVFPVV